MGLGGHGGEGPNGGENGPDPSSSSGGDASGTGGDVSGGAPAVPLEDEVKGPAGQAFLPANITNEYVGMDSSGLTLVSFSLLQSAGLFEEVTWFVALKNLGETPICYPQIQGTFETAAGYQLAKSRADFLEAKPWAAYGSPSPCVGAGEIAMGAVTSGLSGLVVDQVAHIKYGVGGNITPSATPLPEITFESLEIREPFQDSFSLTGKMVNGLNTTIVNPSVEVFVVDAVGRPYAHLSDIAILQVTAGQSWTFDTGTLKEPFENYVIRYDFSD